MRIEHNDYTRRAYAKIEALETMTKANDRKIKQLDTKWREFVSAHGICESCGRPKDDLSWSHIIGRGHLKTRWDVRNLHCMCWFDCHQPYTDQPTAFSRFVESTTCGQYVDTMLIQANSNFKPDCDLWLQVYDIAIAREYTLEQTREWLGDNIMLSELDLLKLD